MDWGITTALNRLHQDHQDLAVIQAEILKKLGEILKNQENILRLMKDRELKTARMDLRKLLQWPIPLYLISGGLLLANYKIQEVAALIEAFGNIP